jgi:hypothetical protein
MRLYSFFLCDNCEEIYLNEEACGAAGEESTKEYLCPPCSKFPEAIAKAAAAANEILKKDSILKKASGARGLLTEDQVFVCDSDENALEQAAEFEAMQAIFPEEITVLSGPPRRGGDPCTRYVIRTPTNLALSNVTRRSLEHNLLSRLCSQLSFEFVFPGGYPSTELISVTLQMGNLSLVELDTQMKKLLVSALVSDLLISANWYLVFGSCFDALFCPSKQPSIPALAL